MRKMRLIAALPLLAAMLCAAPPARADEEIPCQYPTVGFGVDVIGISGKFCDGPTEINGTHYHCEAGGAHLGGLGLAGSNGVSLGALGSIGGGGWGCSFRCPDGTVGPQPNPPGAWKEYLVPRLNFCRGHDAPAGPTSALVDPNEGFPGPPVNPDGPPPPLRGPRPPAPPPTPEGELPLPPVVPPLPALPPLPGLPPLPIP